MTDRRSGGRRGAWAASVGAALALAVVGPAVAGCAGGARGGNGVPGGGRTGAGVGAEGVLERAALAGFRLDLVTRVPPPSLAPLMTGRTLPVSTTVGIYRAIDEPPRAITATLATFAEPIGAAALYNQYFASNAFMASLDRHALDIGDQAECFDAQWPAFHAVIARQGRLFVLVEADVTVPRQPCRDLVATLVDGAGPP